MNPNDTEQIGEQRRSSNFASPAISKGELLLKLLPFGICSKQGLNVLCHEGSIVYELVRLGFVEKTERTIKKKGRYKTEIFCYLTPKGLRRICQDNFTKPAWINNLDYNLDKLCVSPKLKTSELQVLAQIQDLIIFFSFSRIPNILTALLANDPMAILNIQLLAFKLSSRNHNTAIEKVADAVSAFAEEKSDNCFVQNCSAMFLESPERDLSKLFVSDSSYFRTTEKFYKASKEYNREYFLNYREMFAQIQLQAQNPPDTVMRDTSIGIYAGTSQSMPVFVTTKNGVLYKTMLKKKGRQAASLCEWLALGNSRRSCTEICTSAIILFRNRSEFVRTIIDPYDLRPSLNDKTFTPYHHIFLIPMNCYGSYRAKAFAGKTQAEYNAISANMKKAIPDIWQEFVMDGQDLYDMSNQCRAFDLVYLDLTDIYDAMLESERTNAPVTIVIEEWQTAYFDQLQENWKYHKLFNPQAENHGFRYAFMETLGVYDQNPYDNPMPGDGRY